MVNIEVKFLRNEEAEGGQLPLQSHKEQRRKAASRNTAHMQGLCPHQVHLYPCKPDLLIRVCNHLMTACPTKGQGNPTPRLSRTLPNEHPYAITLISGMEEQEEAKSEKQSPRET